MFFDHRATKKQRTKAKGTHVEIHNHIPNSTTPLTDQAGQHRVNTSTAVAGPSSHHPLSDDDDDDIVFPDILEALKKLHKVAPKDEWMLYEIGLRQYGVNYVDGGEGANTVFLRDEVCMPTGLITRFQDTCTRMAARTRKEVRRGPVKLEHGAVKLEEGDENTPFVIA